jgi:REP element-mobilizing transposase RayT
MARKPRIHFEGAIYHVHSRGNGGQRLFTGDSDYRFLIALLSDLRKRMQLKVHAWCLIPNHFHLLMEVGKFSASRIMQSALGRYAQYFNYKHETYGHVFQGRPGMKLCQRDAYYLQLLRYIHLNPVAHGLVTSVDLWPWSSHHTLAWGKQDPLVDRGEILPIFDPDVDRAAGMYRDFVANGDPNDDLPGLPVLDAFAEDPSVSRDLGELAQMIAAGAEMTVGQLRSPTHFQPVSEARHRFVIDAWKAGYASAEIARFLGVSRPAISQILRRKSEAFVNLLTSDPDVQKKS